MSILDPSQVGSIVVSPPDEEYFGDLKLLRPFVSIHTNAFVGGEDGFEVTEQLKKGLEGRINEFFATEGLKLVQGFTSSPLWENFAYMVVLHDSSNKFVPNKHNYESILGILTAFRIKTPEGFEFILYDTIGISEAHRKKGYLWKLFQVAGANDKRITQKLYPERAVALPAGLRTSRKDPDSKYQHFSDYRIPKLAGYDEVGVYFVHLFGFKDARSREPIKDYIAKKEHVADYIANLPPKFINIWKSRSEITLISAF